MRRQHQVLHYITVKGLSDSRISEEIPVKDGVETVSQPDNNEYSQINIDQPGKAAATAERIFYIVPDIHGDVNQ